MRRFPVERRRRRRQKGCISLVQRAVVRFYTNWRPFFLKGAYHHPLTPVNLLHLLNPHMSKEQHLLRKRCSISIMMGEMNFYVISPFYSCADTGVLFIGVAAAFRLEA